MSSANEIHVGVEARTTHSLPRAGEHRRRPVYTNQINTSPPERNRDAAGTATQLKDLAVRPECQIAPERHVPPTQRSRVFPVVERRVIVPAFPSLGVLAARLGCHSPEEGVLPP